MQLHEMKWPEVARLSKDTPVVIPIASLEQHGPHMPLFTDSLLGGEVVRRAHERLKERVLVTPMLWLGNSHHHMDFCGTFSAEPRTYLDMLAGALENFIHHGFRRLVFVNGHGGNIVPGQQAIFEVRRRLELIAERGLRGGDRPSVRRPALERCSGAHREHGGA